jgi:hypothetical protein
MNNLTHLSAAMSLSGTVPGTGTCFHRSAALMLDLPADAVMVFGVLRAATPEEIEKMPNASPVPFIHSWVEFRGMLLAPTTMERTGGELRPMPLEDYYTVNAITRTWRLTSTPFQQVARRFKLSAAFKHGSARAGKGEIIDALLQAAGVRYKLSERRTVLPVD